MISNVHAQLDKHGFWQGVFHHVDSSADELNVVCGVSTYRVNPVKGCAVRRTSIVHQGDPGQSTSPALPSKDAFQIVFGQMPFVPTPQSAETPSGYCPPWCEVGTSVIRCPATVSLDDAVIATGRTDLRFAFSERRRSRQGMAAVLAPVLDKNPAVAALGAGLTPALQAIRRTMVLRELADITLSLAMAAHLAFNRSTLRRCLLGVPLAALRAIAGSGSPRLELLPAGCASDRREAAIDSWHRRFLQNAQ